MAGKYIKLKKIVIPVMTAIILCSQLAGCSTVTSNEMLDMLRNGSDIEIVMAVPSYDTGIVGMVQQTVQDRIQLDRLQTYTIDGFRQEFDSIFNIRELELTNSTSKIGCIYVNKAGFHEGNTVLMDSLRNQVWVETYFENAQSKLASAATLAYIDVDGDDYASVMASLNAYYNLINDSTDGEDTYFNANQSVTRGEFYNFIYRATNPVNNSLKTQGDFINQVGNQDKDSLYASQVDQYAWLNADNGGLRPENYKGSISRAEAVYMLMNIYFGDEMAAIDVEGIKLEDAVNGGNYWDDTDSSKKVSNALYDEKDTAQTLASGWQLGALSKMLSSSDNGVQTDLYRALGVAHSLGIIDAETRYDEPLSKSEAIEMIVAVAEALNARDGYLCELEDGDYSMWIDEVEVTEDTEIEITDVDEETGIESGTIDGEAWAENNYDIEAAKEVYEEQKKAEEQAASQGNGGQNNSGSTGNTNDVPVWTPPANFTPPGGQGVEVEQGGNGGTVEHKGDEDIKWN